MTRTHYVWDPFEDNVIEECDENGDTLVRYTTEPDLYGNLISQERNGVTSYYHFDGQGSTLALTNKDGDVTDEYAYNAFGEITKRSGATENCRRYVGEKGYDYDSDLRAYAIRLRVFCPLLSRWLSQDRLLDAGIMNYVYSANRPTTLVDPSGLEGLSASDVFDLAWAMYEAAQSAAKAPSETVPPTKLVLPEAPEECSSWCLKAKPGLKVVTCSFSIFELVKGPIKCNVAYAELVCSTLKSTIDGLNKKYRESPRWWTSYCPEGCECDFDKEDEKTGVLRLEVRDSVISASGCVFRITGVIELEGTASILPCRKKKGDKESQNEEC